MQITETVAKKVLDTIDAGLCSGLGKPEPGQMCVEAAVCYALDLPHGDDPGCVSSALRQLKIRLNDAQWGSNEARAKGLRRLGLAQLGSMGVLDDVEFVIRVSLLQYTEESYVKWAQAWLSGEERSRKTADAARAAARAAACAACAAARAAARAAAADAADAAAAGDKVLSEFAEKVVQILIEMKAPGTQWLSLTEV